MNLLITPSYNGHFNNYIELLSQEANTVVKSSKKINSIFILIFFIIKNIKIIDKIIFLHGDRDFILSFILKSFFFYKQVNIIIYYSIQDKTNNFKIRLKAFLISILSIIGIKILLLESEPNSCIFFNNKNIQKIYDPILLNNPSKNLKNENLKNENLIQYLVAGYLDSRKSIPLLVDILNTLCNKDKRKRKLILLGVQSNYIKQYLYNLKDLKFQIQIIEHRYQDKELEVFLSKVDIVWAIYNKHYGSSGMIINAIHYSKKVIFLPIGVLNDFAIELQIKFLPLKLDFNKIKNYIYWLENNEQYTNKSKKIFIQKRNVTSFRKGVLDD